MPAYATQARAFWPREQLGFHAYAFMASRATGFQ